MDCPPSPILGSKPKTSRTNRTKYQKVQFNKNVSDSSLPVSVSDSNLLEDGNDTRISDLVNTIIIGTKTIYNSTPQPTEIDDKDLPSYSSIKKLPLPRKLKQIELSDNSLRAASKIFEDIIEQDSYNWNTPRRKYSELSVKKDISFESDTNDIFLNDISDTQMIQLADEITATVEDVKQTSPQEKFEGFTNHCVNITNQTKNKFNENFDQWKAASQSLLLKEKRTNFEGFHNVNIEHNCIEHLHLKIGELENNLKQNNNLIFQDTSKKNYCLKRVLEKCNDNNTKKIKFDNNKNCFQTTSNQNMQIDSDSVKKILLFSDLDEPPPNNVSEHIYKKLNYENKENTPTEAKQGNNNIFGFQTASNKQIRIKEESLQKVKNIFKNLESDLNNEESTIDRDMNYSPIISNIGFFTASNKKVNVNAKLLENARNLLKNCSENDCTNQKDKRQVEDEILNKVKNDQKIFSIEKYNEHFHKSQNLSTAASTNFGFSTASSKKINVSAKSVENARNLLRECSESGQEIKETFLNEVENHQKGSNIGKSVSFNENFQKAPNILTTATTNFGFSTASSKKINVSAKSVENARNLLRECSESGQEINEAFLNEVKNHQKDSNIAKSVSFNENFQKTPNVLTTATTNFGFFTASNKKVNVCAKSLESARNLLKDCSENDQEKVLNDIKIGQENSNSGQCIKEPQVATINSFGSLIASDRKVTKSEKSLENARNLLQDCAEDDFINDNIRKKSNQLSELSNELKIEEEIQSANNIFENLEETQFDSTSIHQENLNTGDSFAKTNYLSVPLVTNNLGFFTASNKNVEIDEKLLKNAQNMLNECYNENNAVHRLNVNKIVEDQNLNFETDDDTELIEEEEENNSKEETLIEDIDIYTEVGSSSDMDTNEFQNNSTHENVLEVDNIAFQAPTAGNLNDWKCLVDQQSNNLRKQLEVMERRKLFLEVQISKINSTSQNTRFKLGRLIQNKQKNLLYKKTLRDFVNNKYPICTIPSDIKNRTLYQNLWQINPDNACNFHFYVPSPPYPPVIELDDDGILIPTTSHYIGISEFRAAFEVLPGVDRKRIPDGWFNNHFRWIIWKLASMDRQFPEYFNGHFLTPRNIMQQLKYRYDRDIDNNERSALRIITEKDEASNRRMVLCVSKVEKQSELVLSDGWYSIRAIFDPLLVQCIRNGKISVGTKLLTYGAELLNCTEASHPLQIPKNVYLKLHGNSTRRVKWDIKLGFHKHHGPFLVSLQSIKSNGGYIGRIMVLISRVLPLKFLEKTSDDVWVCRCKRSESRQQRLWEKEKEKCFEKVQQEVVDNMEKEWKRQIENNRKNYGNIKEISCPQTLLYLLENSSDPGDISELMSESQRETVSNYQRKLQIQRQEEISSKIKTVLDHRGFKERNLHSIAQVIITDADKPNLSEAYILEIWNPDDSFTEIIKQGSILNIYSLTVSDSQDRVLKATKQTRYRRTTKKYSKLECDLLGRCYFLSIEQMQQLNMKYSLQFCDTIGVIVKFIFDCNNSSSVWLADNNFRLLQIQYIMDPNNCLAFQGYKEGDIVAVLNIKVLKSKFGQAQAQIDYVTTVSSNPSEHYIENELKLLKEQMSLMNLSEFLQMCNDQIEWFNKS